MEHERCQIVLEMSRAGTADPAEAAEAEAHAAGCDQCREYASCLDETSVGFEAEYSEADLERLRSSMIRRQRLELIWPAMWTALAGIGVGASLWVAAQPESRTWVWLIVAFVFVGYLRSSWDDLRNARRKIAEAANTENFLEIYRRNEGLRYVMRLLKAVGLGAIGLLMAAAAPFASEPWHTGIFAAVLLVLALYNAAIFLAPFVLWRKS